MEFEAVASAVEGIPLMTPAQGRILYDFVRAARVTRVLELGFAHGVSTCYLAAAVQENGGGSVLTIDRESARERVPDIGSLLERTGLAAHVHPVFTPISYTWELMKLIEEGSDGGSCTPRFDFCFVDGAHAWEPDGLAFFLADKLLVPGGWLLFDDLDWSYASSPTLRESDFVKSMPEDFRSTSQVGKVFSLLVRQHPHYGSFKVDGRWGWARKGGGTVSSRAADADVLERVYRRSLATDAVALLRRTLTRVRRA